MMKVRILNNKVIRSADTEPSAAAVNSDADAVAPINNNDSIETELRTVLGESLEVSQGIYNDLVEEKFFENISQSPAASSASRDQHQNRQLQPLQQLPKQRGKKQQQQQQQQQQEQQKPQQIRRGRKDMGKKRKLSMFSENDSVLSSAVSDDDDDFQVKRPNIGSASAILIKFKKEYTELAKKYADEHEELKAEFRIVTKRREWLIKRMNEVESEKMLVDKTLKQLR